MYDHGVLQGIEGNLRAWMRDEPRLFGEGCGEPHIAWMLHRAALTYVPGGVLVDLGGGLSLLNAALAAAGMEVHVVDLLEEYWRGAVAGDGEAHVRFLAERGVRFHRADLIDLDLTALFGSEAIDVVASHHALEHLHHSPRRLLESALSALRPDGRLVIEVPNAVNLRKRLRVLLGASNYLPYASYFERVRYRDHVREYTVGDLRDLARRLALPRPRIHGRNWYGSLYASLPRCLARIVDHALRPAPGLCGSLFLVAEKRAPTTRFSEPLGVFGA